MTGLLSHQYRPDGLTVQTGFLIRRLKVSPARFGSLYGPNNP